MTRREEGENIWHETDSAKQQRLNQKPLPLQVVDWTKLEG
jgi:hypothetical protein